MYNIELEHLTLQNAQQEILRATENVCDTFQLSDHFGTLSFALHELVCLMERFCDDQEKNFSVNFFVSDEKVSVQVAGVSYLKEIENALKQANINDVETAAFTVANLTDHIEFRNDKSEIWVDFHVKPVIGQIDRAELLQKEIFQSNRLKQESLHD